MNAHRNRGSVGQLPMREPTTDIGANIDVSHSDTDACAPVWLLLRLRVALVATIAVTSISVLISLIARMAITPIWAPRWRSSPIVFLVHSVSSVVGPLFGVRRSRCQGQCAQASCFALNANCSGTAAVAETRPDPLHAARPVPAGTPCYTSTTLKRFSTGAAFGHGEVPSADPRAVEHFRCSGPGEPDTEGGRDLRVVLH